MVTAETTYAIDAEFATYGPIAFDVCKMVRLPSYFFLLSLIWPHEGSTNNYLQVESKHDSIKDWAAVLTP